MKFWQKIYLISILVFFVIFNAASIMVIERSHNKVVSQEMNNALSQNMSIHSSVDAIVPILRIYDSVDYEKTVLTNIANEFVGRNSDQLVYLDIRNDAGDTIFTNVDFKFPEDRKELDGLLENEIKYIVRDIDKRTFVFTTNIVDINHKKYVFTYIKDITAVYKDRIDQYQFFVQVDVAVFALYLIIMYFVSKGLTRPIDRLNDTARRISKGEFSERVRLKSKDEIGVLANNFNEMASVVEDKINELEQINEGKQRFINNFTHELKTPLTSIIGYANFLRTTKYNEELFVDALDVIYSEGKRLESLSLKLMDLILLQGEQLELTEHDMCKVIGEMKSALRMKAKDKQVLIVTDCEAGKLFLEKDLIKTLIFNLVDNALKASTPEQQVTIRTYWMDDDYILEVIDKGVGIAKEHQDKIFEPFYMADKARTKSNNGAGLGLAICHSVATLHHAVMEVTSEENVGTTIRVIFSPFVRKGGTN
ncbi:HAMP domain-containing histidine kinase [Paenibacillus sp. GSMTC-2017]|uniref:sensor histidine kinase n=1 Tax=Paenibacillus sp. GSMTC-2017 TaxID=2794350 RepID=UPI0018D9231A|nr:HAMP domain-containing sensor histidine kinase [Paenibacillus sp. GSMTC-2017]MBH5320922.1 HAMP domain-containing histidine kinase [Paenibacillus sp. GSMTC-2017]